MQHQASLFGSMSDALSVCSKAVQEGVPAELQQRAGRLFADVEQCARCPRMCGRTRVLGPQNGSLRARILFVAEAPGRLGAERSGIPLQGDQTGRNFEVLLAQTGLTRAEVFITNAVLCNPQDTSGNNAPPRQAETDQCLVHLKETIDLIAPEVVVSLGRVALESLRKIGPHDVTLQDVGRIVPWYGRALLALYHPGARARIHRPLPQQLLDMAVLSGYINRGAADGSARQI